MANPALNEKRFEQVREDERSPAGPRPDTLMHGAGRRHAAAGHRPRRGHDGERDVRQDLRRCSCSCSPAARSAGRRPTVSPTEQSEDPGLDVDLPDRRLRARDGVHLQAEGVAVPRAALRRARRRVPRCDLEGVRGPVGRHRLPGGARHDRRVLRHARALRVRRGQGHPEVPDGGDRRDVWDLPALPVRRAPLALRRRRRVLERAERARASSSAS